MMKHEDICAVCDEDSINLSQISEKSLSQNLKLHSKICKVTTATSSIYSLIFAMMTRMKYAVCF